MLERTDFIKKQFVIFTPSDGDKLSFLNDNMVIRDAKGKIKVQVTCYRIMLIFIIGDTSITTGFISRACKYGISICLMNRSMKMYKFIGHRMEGNTLLRMHQYEHDGNSLAQHIILNKVQNQRNCLKRIRNKNENIKNAILILNRYCEDLCNNTYDRASLLGIEGSASRTYFPQAFNVLNWPGRKPRIKSDYINASLDIGYTILFNVIDALINMYGFDEYQGVLHTNFYMRKSLVCDIMEPFRPIIDYSLRNGIALKQIKAEDFEIINHRYVLQWKKSKDYAKLFLDSLMEYKNDIFIYIQSYYRCFMKQKDSSEFPMFDF